MFSGRDFIGDVRTSVVSMITTGALLFLASIGGAIWKSVRAQPVPWVFLILIGIAGIALLGAAKIKLVKAEKKKEQVAPTVHPVPSVQPMMSTIPAQDLSYLADPAYDRFWPDSWRDALIRRGQSVVEQWTTRLEYPEKKRRENDSKNWLCEANEFARKHLTSAQMNEFTLRHSTAASVGRKYDFAMALTQSGTVPSSEDGNLAFEIFGKVKALERFRSEPTRPSPTQAKLRKNRSPAVAKVIDDALRMTRERNIFTFYALQLAGVGDLDSEEEFSEVREAVIQHGLGDPLIGCWITQEEPKWLDFIKFANRKGTQLVSVVAVLDCLNDYYIGESKQP